MLPDLPNFKRNLHKRLVKEFRQAIHDRIPVALVGKPHVLHEGGGRYSLERSDGTVWDGQLKHTEAAFSVAPDEVPNLGLDQIKKKLAAPAEDTANQMGAMFLEKLNEEIERVGNALKESGPFTQDTLLSALAKIHIDFGGDDRPFIPTLLAGPELAAVIQRELSRWEEDPAFKRKWDDLIARKRREFYDREGNRALVD